MKEQKIKPRNFVTQNMLKYARNSVHGKSKKALRRKEKMDLKKMPYSLQAL